jgi:hypothetical protein
MGFTGLRDVELMVAHLNGTIQNPVLFQGIDNEGSRRQFANGFLRRISADVHLHGGHELCFVLRAALVVEEHEVIGRNFFQRGQVAFVKALFEDNAVAFLESAEEFRGGELLGKGLGRAYQQEQKEFGLCQ